MNEIESSVALGLVPGIGPISFNQLVGRAGSAQALFAAAADKDNPLGLPSPLRDALRQPDLASVEREMTWARHADRHILLRSDPRYPTLLGELRDAPPILYIEGNIDCLQRQQLAIVGSRNPTTTGKESAFRFAMALATGGIVVTSGLALGIDSAAHEGALATKAGTIAVMGTGLGRVYPARNQGLARRILDGGGALVSEFPVDTGPARENFPRRNRIISGMSLGTLVVEAARRSGSLITARLAGDQGREVFAIPGAVQNPLARGCHALIKDGAKLVETVDDILEELAQYTDVATTQQSLFEENNPTPALDPDHQTVLSCLGFEPTAIDTVVSRSGLTAPTISSMLLVLELQGFIQTHTGGFYSRIK